VYRGLLYFFEGYLLLRIFFNALIEMIPRNGFIISIFLFLFIAPFSTQAQNTDCRKVSVSVDVTHSSNGGKGTIKVSSNDSNAKFMLHLLSERAGSEQLKETSGTIRNIPPGTYDLVIHYPDPKYCSETRKVTVN